jgi:fused signal recognition particle receptor
MLKKWFGRKDNEAQEQEQERPGTPEEEGTEAEQPAPSAAPAEEPVKKSRWSLFSRALAKTRKGLKAVFTFRREISEELLDEIEAELFATDFGPELVDDLLHGPDGVRAAWKEKRIQSGEDVRAFLKERLRAMLTRRETRLEVPPRPPFVILVAGVNGTGKTTSIAKLAKRFRDEGKTVILAAADTFRAAAVEQLTIWSQRLGLEIITGDAGADPASVAFRSAEAALEKQADCLIVDTAGRLHTQKNLMRELGKIHKVLSRKIPDAPHESLMVLDATTGQNALSQARLFGEEIRISGIILAKLDGTAKGGIVVTINNALDIPVKFVGVGEKVEDLEAFDVDRFVEALFEE